MTKELQDLAWRCLPREFKEEVKKEWGLTDNAERLPHDAFLRGKYQMMRDLFGSQRLSDELNEDNFALSEPKPTEPKFSIDDTVRRKSDGKILTVTGFDTKNGEKVALLEDKREEDLYWDYLYDLEPYEPPFETGDKVRFKEPYVVADIEGGYVALEGVANLIDPDNLEPYTDPNNKDSEFIRAESVKEARIADEETHLRNLSQEAANCDKHSNNTLTDTQNAEIDPFVVKDEMVDKIIKDGFREHNRLHVASIVMAGLLAGGKEKHLVRRALELADALIKESEKGDNP